MGNSADVATPNDPPGKMLIHRAAAVRASGSLAVLSPQALFEAVRHARRDLRLVMRSPASGGLVVVVFAHGEPTMVFSPGDGRSVGELLLAAGVIDNATLTRLVEERPTSASSLEDLVRGKTSLARSEVQRFLDFQARMRLLDALVWEEGFFELEEYDGGGEAAFSLRLPHLSSLVMRARARAEALPGLIDRLPASPGNTLVRRRRGGSRPTDALGAAIHAALDQPLLVPQLVARLLVDDDLVLDAVLHMVQEKSLAIQPRAALAPVPNGESADPRCAALLRAVIEKARGAEVGPGVAALWAVLVSASPDDAMHVVGFLGGEPGVVMVHDPAGVSTGLASRTIRVGDDARLCLLAVRPESLSRGALEGVMARCDAVALVRTSGDGEELERLEQLRRLAEGPGFGWQPLLLGIELGDRVRPWGDPPDATLTVSDWETRDPAWLVERLLEGLLAAAGCRPSR